MNDIRKQNTVEKKDNNFIVIDNKDFGTNLLSVLFVISKTKVSKEALSTLLLLLSNSSLDYPNPHSRFIHSAIAYGADFSLKLEESYDDYLVKASITSPINNSIFLSRRMQSKAIGELKNILKRSWSKKSQEIYNSHLYIEQCYEKLDNDPLFVLKRLMRINLLPKYPFGTYPYGEYKNQLQLTDFDIQKANKVLLDSEKIVCYIGDTDFRPVLQARLAFAPSRKLISLRYNGLVLTSEKELESYFPGLDRSMLGLAFRMPFLTSEKTYLCLLLMKDIMYSPQCGSVNFKLQKLGFSISELQVFIRGGVFCLYLSKEDNISKEDAIIVKQCVLSAYRDDMYASFSQASSRLSRNLALGDDSIYQSSDCIFSSRLSGLDFSLNALLPILCHLSYVDFLQFVRMVGYIGSIILKENQDNDNK
jgi:hypothetical protein